MPRLENWNIQGECLTGKIFNDTRFADGAYIRTSTVTSIDLHNKRAQTRNTLYELGKVSEDYVDKFIGRVKAILAR